MINIMRSLAWYHLVIFPIIQHLFFFHPSMCSQFLVNYFDIVKFVIMAIIMLWYLNNVCRIFTRIQVLPLSKCCTGSTHGYIILTLHICDVCPLLTLQLSNDLTDILKALIPNRNSSLIWLSRDSMIPYGFV